ncbi:MAG: mannose-1-phosphate guanylyltransferase [Planctomycetota bacterium]
MRYAMIMAGGSGTRLWPMSVKSLPKQLIPFIEGDDGSAKSLLQIAMDRLDGFLPDEQLYVCAGESTRAVMLNKLAKLTPDRFIGEPTGRDTLNAVGLTAAVLHKLDPEAVFAVFTADHIIEPVDRFQEIVKQGFELAERAEPTLVTFGIAPTHAATGYGYLQLGDALGDGASVVSEFKEKPEQAVAEQYFQAGASKYLWNSGMFVWKASSVMAAIKKFAPENHAMLAELGDAWGTAAYGAKIADLYPKLPKISVDFAIMEPSSTDADFTVAAVPMPLKWLDVGSWPSFAETLNPDAGGNCCSGTKAVNLDSKNVLIAGDDPDHVVATLGCEDLIVIHTKGATLVCPRGEAERIKELHKAVGEQAGEQYL